MKLNADCIRDILLTIESSSPSEFYTFHILCEALPKYSEEELQYTCLMLEDGNLLELESFPVLRQKMLGIKSVNLTFDGHQFISNIRSDNNWTKVKDKATKIGSFSVHTLKDIAIGVITELINKNL